MHGAIKKEHLCEDDGPHNLMYRQGKTCPEDLVKQRRCEIAHHLGLYRNLRIPLTSHEAATISMEIGSRFPRRERRSQAHLVCEPDFATIWIHVEILHMGPQVKHNEIMALLAIVEDSTIACTIHTFLSLDKMTYRAMGKIHIVSTT